MEISIARVQRMPTQEEVGPRAILAEKIKRTELTGKVRQWVAMQPFEKFSFAKSIGSPFTSATSL
jgi:hypothetical protein